MPISSVARPPDTPTSLLLPWQIMQCITTPARRRRPGRRWRARMPHWPSGVRSWNWSWLGGGTQLRQVGACARLHKQLVAQLPNMPRVSQPSSQHADRACPCALCAPAQAARVVRCLRPWPLTLQPSGSCGRRWVPDLLCPGGCLASLSRVCSVHPGTQQANTHRLNKRERAGIE
jgi:hypothetical protein